MRPAVRDVSVSVAGMVLLFMVLAMTDARVSERISSLASQDVPAHVARQTGQLAAAGVTIRDLVVDHDTLTIFVIAGTVLVACMLRS